MNPIISGKLRQISGFCLLGIIAGLIFQLLHEGIVDFRAVLIGVSLGGAFGIIEFFCFIGPKDKIA